MTDSLIKMNRHNLSRLAVSVLACAVVACGVDPQTDAAPDAAPVSPAPSAQPPTQQPVRPSGPHEVSGFVFEDKNRNGQYDSTDVRLAQQTVMLTDPSTSELIQSVTTGADGAFRMDALAAGEYRLTLLTPEGFDRTTDDSFVIKVASEGGIAQAQFGIAPR